MTNSRALANQERQVQVKRISRLAKALLLSMATLMTFITVTLLMADKLYQPDAFVIDQLKIRGKFRYLDVQEVQAAVFAEPVGNFFSIELNEIKQRVEALPWVQQADVRREWPHALAINVREHRPLMRWQTVPVGLDDNVLNNTEHKSVEQWVSTNGQIISLERPLDKSSQIKLVGTERDARQLLMQAMRWQKQLAPSGVRVLEVSLSPSQAWHLQLAYLDQEGAFELLLGREHVEDRLRRFQTLFDAQFKQATQELIRVDARYPDGLAVGAKKLSSEAKHETASGSKRGVANG